MSEQLKKDFLTAVENLCPAGKGSIREVHRKCTKKKCELCESGERHIGYLLTYYKEGKQYSKYVPNSRMEEVKTILNNGRKLEALMVDYLLAVLSVKREK